MMLASILIQVQLALFQPGESSSDPAAELEQVLQTMTEAEPLEFIERLVPLLSQLECEPDRLLTDSAIFERLLRTRLAIAWAYLVAGDEPAAMIAMDEAIRTAAGRQIPITEFGPTLKRLYDERRQLAASLGTGTITVDCKVACEILVNEQRSVNPTVPLWLGTYRVWVIAVDATSERTTEPMYVEVSLVTPGQSAKLEFGEVPMVPVPHLDDLAPEIGSSEVPPTDSGDERATTRRRRLLPRWAEVAGVVVGAGMLGIGAAWPSIMDRWTGTCRGNLDGDTTDVQGCSEIAVVSEIPGYVVLGLGAGILATSSVTLTVDEVRLARTRGRVVAATWTFRF